MIDSIGSSQVQHALVTDICKTSSSQCDTRFQNRKRFVFTKTTGRQTKRTRTQQECNENGSEWKRHPTNMGNGLRLAEKMELFMKEKEDDTFSQICRIPKTNGKLCNSQELVHRTPPWTAVWYIRFFIPKRNMSICLN